jgi:hypothetical protein
MTIQVISLEGGSVNAHQSFSVQLGDNFLTFTLGYLQSGQWFVNIDREGVRLVSGAMLEPNCDTIEAWNLTDDIGWLVFTGADTTLDNLGVENTLTWVSPDESF